MTSPPRPSDRAPGAMNGSTAGYPRSPRADRRAVVTRAGLGRRRERVTRPLMPSTQVRVVHWVAGFGTAWREADSPFTPRKPRPCPQKRPEMKGLTGIDEPAKLVQNTLEFEVFPLVSGRPIASLWIWGSRVQVPSATLAVVTDFLAVRLSEFNTPRLSAIIECSLSVANRALSSVICPSSSLLSLAAPVPELFSGARLPAPADPAERAGRSPR
jgi:hypothetical protein